MAEWTAEELAGRGRRGASGDARIRAGEFWPPTDPPPSLFSEFAAICQDDRFAAAALKTEGRGGIGVSSIEAKKAAPRNPTPRFRIS